jgi:hypothetical protein
MDATATGEANPPEPPAHHPDPTGEASTPESATVPRPRSAGRQRLIALTSLAAAAAAALAITLAFTLNSSGTSSHAASAPPERTVPVTYDVTGTGTAQITYAGHGASAETVTVHLPWHQSAELAAGHGPATISIVLGQSGGRATCALTIHGTPVQHATAYGSYGRATCSTNLTTNAAS